MDQAIQDQVQGLPFNTVATLPALMGSAEGDALQLEPRDTDLSVLSLRQKDTCTHDLEQLYSCSRLGASGAAEDSADRGTCCKRLANLTARNCFW